MNTWNICRHVTLLTAVAATLTLTSTAWATPSVDERAGELLDRIATTGTGEERVQAAAELAELGADAIDGLQEFLARKRTSKGSDRRAVLKAIKADLPNKKGRFRTPRRGDDPVNRGDDFDWLKELAKVDTDKPGYGDVVADVAAIRALAASETARAGHIVLDFTFTGDGLLYRDECGRYLRKMSPYSLPALIIISQDSKKTRSQRRYAGYQLDRLDRDDPNKALSHASGDPALLLDVFAAFGKSKHREAIRPLLRYSDHPAPSVREAARKAFLLYVTGKKPKDSPKKRLQRPGGKLTVDEQPLWMNYRDMAIFHVRRTYEEVFGEKPPRRKSTAKLAKMTFKRMDERRAEAQGKAFDEATALAEAQKWADATAAFDRILAVQPEHPKREDMVSAYFEHGRELAKEGAFEPAAAAFSKAHGLAPSGDLAEKALSSHYAALGKALEADGKDASAAFRRARKNQPAEQPVTDDLAPEPAPKPRYRWMLYAGVGGGAGALILFILGLAIRRR